MSLIKFITKSAKLVGNGVTIALTKFEQTAEQLEIYSSAMLIKNNIKMLENEISRSSNYSAAQEVEVKKQLIGHYESLIKLPISQEPDHNAINRKLSLEFEIKSAEERRNFSRQDHYPSGSIKRRISTYDGKLHGQCEYWYESNALNVLANFKNGLPDGITDIYNEDGSKKINCQFSKGTVLSWIVYSLNGQIIMECSKTSNNKFHCNFWLTNGVPVGKIFLNNGKVQGKIIFILKLIFNLKFIKTLLDNKKNMGNITELGDRIKDASEEIAGIKLYFE